MGITFRPLSESDEADYLYILNYYIRTGFNAYPDTEFGPEQFRMLYNEFRNYPNICCEDEGHVIGYAHLRAFRKFPCFDRTAEITYFIAPEYTGEGLGTRMLARIKEQAKAAGIKVIMANISSLNEGSLKFHQKHGFVKCGEFKNVVEKSGTVFNMVWVQLEL